MTTYDDLLSIAGGAELVEWFSRVTRFHDAEILELTLSGKGCGLLRIHAWTMTDCKDEHGYFITENHAVVSFHLDELKEVTLMDADMQPAIIGFLDISRSGEQITIEWDASYGVYGQVRANRVSISLLPGRPE